ncbi:MAG: S9 family peptidase [Gemmatimonadaceae bacterium]|nr:S9 family peptidase [Gemmatimonadaceae bacterium]
MLVLLASASVAATLSAQTSVPPVARVIPRVDTIAGHVLTDNYFWLRNRADSSVIRYLEAENRYTESVMADTKPLQDTLYNEMLGRIKQTDLSVPVKNHGYYYYSRTVEGKQYPIFARKRGSLGAPEEIYLDQNELAGGRKYFSIGVREFSPDQNWLAFTTDTAGSEHYTVWIKNLKTGEILPDRIPEVHFSLSWGADNRTFFYSRTDSSHRSDRIFRHTVGTPADGDVMVFHEPDLLFGVAVDRTKDDKFNVITSGSFTSGETWYVPASTPTAKFRLLEKRRPDVVYSVEHHGNDFFILTNENATNFKLVKAPDNAPARKSWKNVIPERKGFLITGFDVFRNFLVLSERGNAETRVRVRDLRTGAEHYVRFDEPIYTLSQSGTPEFDTDVMRLNYTSFLTPSSVYDYEMSSRKLKLLKKTDVLGGYDPALYTTERTWATATDGTKIPISLVYRKPLVRDGKRPLFLYAYGSYGSSSDPTFSSNLLSLIDRGFVYGIAHIRGGQEMGRAWYDNGKMFKKKNTFTDFVDAAQYLVNAKYTSSDRLVARGGSAGGLLMGVVANLRPDLFKAIVADVPFVDVINTMRDASIPLTTGEWIQWGNPNLPKDFAYMMTYSPYDNVAAKKYPTMLVTTSLNDPRVAYWEPAKWVAKLRAMKTDKNLLLLKTNMGAGHGGSSGRYDALRDQAFRYAFVLKALALTSGAR